MARAKTKLVNGQRVDVNTGQPFANQSRQTTDQFGASALADRVRTTLGTPNIPTNITGRNLTTTPSLSLPSIPPQTESLGLLSSIENSNNQTMEARVREETARFAPGPDEALTRENAQIRNKIGEILGGGGEVAKTDRAYQDEVDPAKRELDQIQSQIRDKTHAYRRRVEAIQNNAVGRETSGMQNAVDEITRSATREIADLSIIEQSKLQNYSTAKDIADRQVAAELEKDRSDLAFLQFVYTENKATLDKAEERQYAFMLAERTRLLAEETFNKQQISNIKLTAAQYGATASDLSAIGQAKTFDEAINAAGKFLGAPFALQMRAQAFQENLQSEALKSEMNKASQEANKLFANTDEAKAVSAIQGQVAQVDELLTNLVGTADRNMSDENWATISKNSSAVRAIANAEARSLNPDLAKRADGGDLASEEAIARQATQLFNKYSGGSAASISNLKGAVRQLDSSYQARIKQANLVLKNFQQLYPQAQILTTYQQVNGVSLKDKLAEAQTHGAQPVQIIEYLQNDPIVGPQIIQSLQSGYTPLQIFNYLQSQ